MALVLSDFGARPPNTDTAGAKTRHDGPRIAGAWRRASTAAGALLPNLQLPWIQPRLAALGLILPLSLTGARDEGAAQATPSMLEPLSVRYAPEPKSDDLKWR